MDSKKPIDKDIFDKLRFKIIGNEHSNYMNTKRKKKNNEMVEQTIALIKEAVRNEN